MPVHMFVVESVADSAMGGDSIRDVYPLVRMYFREHDQAGDLDDRHMKCKDRNEVVQALTQFGDWANVKAPEEPKWLWVSLHGKAPVNPHHVGTRCVSATYDKEDNEKTEEIMDWNDVFRAISDKCPPNVLIVMDVCWGGSPSAPSRVSNRANTPVLMFGPIRAAHRVELNTASALITAAMIKGQIPPLPEAKEIVSTLNRWFPPDPVNRKEFYRVWNWNNGHLECFPAPKTGIVRDVG